MQMRRRAPPWPPERAPQEALYKSSPIIRAPRSFAGPGPLSSLAAITLTGALQGENPLFPPQCHTGCHK